MRNGHTLVTAARLERLPFPENHFDLAWCAQSLYTMPDPIETLAQIVRFVRPGGSVAVLEDDTLHHVLLPWPIEIELALRGAELLALAEHSMKPRKFYVGRSLLEVLSAAGLRNCRVRTYATDRTPPLDSDLAEFLTLYLTRLKQVTAPYLETALRARVCRLLDPNSAGYILNSPDLTVTVLDHVVWGVKP
jgi:SAM-dependent methyltransferase